MTQLTVTVALYQMICRPAHFIMFCDEEEHLSPCHLCVCFCNDTCVVQCGVVAMPRSKRRTFPLERETKNGKNNLWRRKQLPSHPRQHNESESSQSNTAAPSFPVSFGLFLLPEQKKLRCQILKHFQSILIQSHPVSEPQSSLVGSKRIRFIVVSCGTKRGGCGIIQKGH